MVSASNISALAVQITQAVEKVAPDTDPLTMRSACLVAADAFLQQAAQEQIVNSVYRKPSSGDRK